MTRCALAIVAHPDDIEFMMAGTLVLLGQAGYELHYMTVANGNCGSVSYDAATTARIRREEAMRAAAHIGAVYHESLCNDLEVFDELGLLRRLTAVVRAVAPEILLTHPPADYMEDHMNTCRLALTAAFARGAPNFVSDPPQPAVTQEVTVYHALPYSLHDPLNRPAAAEFYVDVGSVLGVKAAMLREHRSQQEWLDVSQGMGLLADAMEAGSRAVGRLSGRYEFAEGWTRHLHQGYCAPGADPLRAALASYSTRET